jgi:hypothetical protein
VIQQLCGFDSITHIVQQTGTINAEHTDFKSSAESGKHKTEYNPAYM